MVFFQRKLKQRWDNINAQTHTTALYSYKRKVNAFKYVSVTNIPKVLGGIHKVSEEDVMHVTLKILRRTIEK